MKRWITCLTALATLVTVDLATQSRAGDKGDPGLTLTLRSKKDSYKLDLGGKTAKEIEELIDAAKKSGKALPKPPAVEFELEIKNTSKDKIDFWSKGDPVQYLIELKGPNAKTVNPPLAFTADFRLPMFMTLEPGKTHVIPINAMQSGFRGAATWHYWLAPGEYTVTASFKTGVRPIPPGAKDMDGAGAATLVSKPITIKVVE